MLSDVRAERQITQRRVSALSPSARKELLRMKRVVETNRVLLPDAPPRKRRTRNPSPEREPCIFVPGAGPSSTTEAEEYLEPEVGPSSVPSVPEAGPSGEPKARCSWESEAGCSWEPEAGCSWEPEAGCSWEPEADTLPEPEVEHSREPEAGPSASIEVPDDSVIIEYVYDGVGDQVGDGAVRMGMEVAVSAELDIHSTPEIKKGRTIIGIHDTNLADTVDEWMQMESDDDFNDETDHNPPQTIRKASTEPASMTDYTTFEQRILVTEDAINLAKYCPR
ncbi:hypothetical protein PYW07_006633 [Mythimna separata]|uniref:Uncharacterized protein n=1 Tax=Mythimna separata TaxID=271217 RepID=A0AAD7YTZ2_MYTSE|nr:hypothetical protein PYW07_006633 [Mythimna separata]